jgi:Acetyltransferases, including N-acetylases of ribosomal proteins
MTVIVPASFELETERLRLRLLDVDDEALFCALYTDTETMRFIGLPLSLSQATGYFRKIIAGMRQQPVKWLYLVIVERGSQRPLGICGMPQFSLDSSRMELGIVLNMEARSRGVAREGLAALMKMTFALLPVKELWAQFSGAHPAGERVALSLGFRSCADAVVAAGDFPKREWSIHRPS